MDFEDEYRAERRLDQLEREKEMRNQRTVNCGTVELQGVPRDGGLLLGGRRLGH